jgi:hypothetical protein
MSGDNSLSELPCSDSRAALGIDWEATRESRDAHSIWLGSVHFMRVLDASCHDRAGPSRHQHGHFRMPLSALWAIPRHGARQIAAPARRAVVEAAVDQAADAEWPTRSVMTRHGLSRGVKKRPSPVRPRVKDPMSAPARAHADAYDVSCSGCGRVLRLAVTRLDVTEQLRAKGWTCRGWGEHGCPDCVGARVEHGAHPPHL